MNTKQSKLFLLKALELIEEAKHIVGEALEGSTSRDDVTLELDKAIFTLREDIEYLENAE